MSSMEHQHAVLHSLASVRSAKSQLSLQARNLSSAMSAASSACDHIYNWINGTPKDTWVSMGVYSDGSYNAPKVQKLLVSLFSFCHLVYCGRYKKGMRPEGLQQCSLKLRLHGA